MDSVFISALRIPTSIGIHQWEQQIKQTLVIDIEAKADLQLAGQKDDVALTIDYWAMIQAIKQLLTGTTFKLIEAVAEAIAQLLLSDFSTSEVTVQVAKPSVASDVKQVAVKITRGK